jgi:uncharacterized protein DUF2752
MPGVASRPGFAAAATGLAIVLEALIARLLLRADEARVYVLGHPVGWVCGLRSRLGLPCPTCGMTRSLVLSLHGEISRAWHMVPGGPVILFGLLGFAAALLVLGRMQWQGAKRGAAGAGTWLRHSALIYAAVAMLVWIGGWAAAFSAALRAR